MLAVIVPYRTGLPANEFPQPPELQPEVLRVTEQYRANNNADAGIEANCPSSLTQNTATGRGTNLVLNGSGCTHKSNVTN